MRGWDLRERAGQKQQHSLANRETAISHLGTVTKQAFGQMPHEKAISSPKQIDQHLLLQSTTKSQHSMSLCFGPIHNMLLLSQFWLTISIAPPIFLKLLTSQVQTTTAPQNGAKSGLEQLAYDITFRLKSSPSELRSSHFCERNPSSCQSTLIILRTIRLISVARFRMHRVFCCHQSHQFRPVKSWPD